MSSDSVKQSQDEAMAGVAAIQQGRKDQAGPHFLRSLQYLDHVKDLRERRNLLSEISEFFLRFGFEDLALMAVLDALEADKQLGFERGLLKDHMTYANIHTRLENLEQAEAIYRAILDRALKNGDYANAAAASTNLAGILADNNYLEEATQLLDNSLEYLKVENNRGTEIITRMTLIQVLEVRKSDPQRTFDEIRTVLDRFTNDLPPKYSEILARAVESALKRYPQDLLGIDVEEWKKQEFPELDGN